MYYFICFTKNRTLNASHILMWYFSEKIILGKQINDSICISQCMWTLIKCQSGATCLFTGLLLKWASTIKIQLSMLVYFKADLIIISLKIKLFSPWYSWKIAVLALNNNHSLTHSFHQPCCLDYVPFLQCLHWLHHLICCNYCVRKFC